MAFEIFGYEISKKKDKAPKNVVATPVTPRDDGASIVYSSDSGSYGAAAGYYGYQFDLDGVVRNESQMINQYRTVACFPEVDGAIEAIVNDAVILEQGRDPVSLNLDELPKQYQPLRDTIRQHFDHVLNILDFNDNCHDIFKRWYIDGRLYYYVMIDPKNPKKGIVDLKYIDPRKIRKVIEYRRENRNGVDVIVGQKSYYIFNDAGLQSAALGVKLSTDSIINVRSGLVDANTGEVISHLFKGIKPANQLKMMEDALVIYRITRAPERRVFYVDVGNLPGLKAEQYVNNVMNKFRNKVVYDAETGEIKNNRNYMSVCFTMDTKVPLLDGRTLTIEQIANQYKTNDLYAYSCDPQTGKIEPGKIEWAGVTGHDREVIRLTLDNGETITCTPDHRFVVREGGFVEAQDLQVGQGLMPFYTRKQVLEGCSSKDGDRYLQVFDNASQTWLYAHRMVVQWKADKGIEDNTVFDPNKHPEFVLARRSKYAATYTQTMYDALFECAKLRMTFNDAMKCMNENTELVEQLKVADANKCISNKQKRYDRFNRDDLYRIIKQFNGTTSYRTLVDQAIHYNHKIVKIEKLDETVDVGCIRIDNQHHTFALDAGVFVHNCEDFWLPRREGGKATEIQTLPGGTGLNELADVEYFQKKLYQSLNVPRQRLMNDNVMSIGNPNEVTREELAFAKFIQRLRNRFNVLFKEALRIQLITTNCIRQSDWEKIRNCIYIEYQHDNYFEELKRIEVFNERMTQLQTADGFKGIYFSKEYIVRNILEMSQEEWEEIQQQMKKEKIDEAREAAELENAGAGDQGGDEQYDSGASDETGGEDDGYNDFVSGNDNSPDEAPSEVDQQGDTTETIDDTAEPNPGEDDFDRPATPGLKATM